jgi:signal transduction histidine kinase
MLAELGGNSFRTWGADNIDAQLDEAQKLGLSVAVGIWLGQERQGFNYDDPKQVADQLERVLGIAGVLALGLNVTQFDTLFHVIPLPEASVVTLSDSTGRVLARSLDPEQYIGKVAAESAVSPREVAQTRVMFGLDGIRRVYGNAVVDRGPWVISVGIPTRVAAERSAPQWRRGFIIADGAICAVLLMALFLSTLMSKGVNSVREAVQRIGSGDLSPPAPDRVPNLELARLQEEFITMASNLRDTHHALDQQIEQERHTREALQSLQRQVVRQERLAAVGILVSGVAHELNNPLQAILGTAELLERHPQLTAEAVEEIAFIKTQSGRAREIIRNLSRFSSQQSGPPSLVDLREVVAEVVQLRQRNLDISSIALEIQASTARKVQANFTEAGGSPFHALTPYLDRFASRSLYMASFYNAVTPTINALISSQCGILSQVENSSLEADRGYTRNLSCLSDVLHDAGYSCSMFYSSYFDYTGFRDFLKNRGLDEMYDADTMPGQRGSERVEWGLLEEETLGAIRNQIQKYHPS